MSNRTAIKKPVPKRVQGHLGPCTHAGCYHVLSLEEEDPRHRYILKVGEQDGHWAEEGQEVVLFWVPADDVPAEDLVTEPFEAPDPKKLRLVTEMLRYQPDGTSVEVEVKPRDTNDSVAVVKSLKPPYTEKPQYEGIYPTWRMLVKHRDSGPKEYHLAFNPNLEELQEDQLVRIYWVARNDEVAKKTGWALRVNVIGEVRYRN